MVHLMTQDVVSYLPKFHTKNLVFWVNNREMTDVVLGCLNLQEKLRNSNIFVMTKGLPLSNICYPFPPSFHFPTDK